MFGINRIVDSSVPLPAHCVIIIIANEIMELGKNDRLILDKSKAISNLLEGLSLSLVFMILANVILNVYYNMRDQVEDFDQSVVDWLGNIITHILGGDSINTGNQQPS